jgi:lambda repressor-like predicted transcriptional regulator
MTDDLQDILRQAIAAELERRGWSRAELARQAGLHQPDVHRMLDGARRINVNHLLAIAHAFRGPAAPVAQDLAAVLTGRRRK